MQTHRQRLENCLSGATLDRLPVAIWRHFPVDDQSPEGLAAATLTFQKIYDFDLVKVTPESSFCLKDWGARDEWQGATEGTRTYTHRVISNPDHWQTLKPLNPKEGYLGRQLECLRIIRKSLGEETPVIQTIFSPLSQAKNLVGSDSLLVHLRRYPQALKTGLELIVESTQRFINAAIETGIDGIFYAVQHAQYGLLSEEEYHLFGRNYDLQVLEPANELWLNMLHLHGKDVMFDHFLDYPIQAINWHDRETSPNLAHAQAIFPGIVCGGLRREESIVLGTPEIVHNEALDAVQQTGGKRFILGTGCVVPITAPHGNLLAARQAAKIVL